MATTTTNLGLTLPAGSDPADIAVLNTNFTTIDTFAGQQTAKDTAQDGRLTDLETSDTSHDSRLTALETSDTSQNSRLSALETSDTSQNSRLSALETSDTSQNSRLSAVETKNTTQDGRLTALETSDTAQDGRLSAVEAKNTAQDAAIEGKASVRDICGTGTSIAADTDLNTITAVGTYTGASNGNYSNCPISAAFRLEVVNVAYSSRRQQRLYPQSATANAFYIRSEGPQGFGVWYKFEGVAVS